MSFRQTTHASFILSLAGSFMKDEVLPARIDHGRSKFWRCVDDKSLGSRSCLVADMTCWVWWFKEVDAEGQNSSCCEPDSATHSSQETQDGFSLPRRPGCWWHYIGRPHDTFAPPCNCGSWRGRSGPYEAPGRLCEIHGRRVTWWYLGILDARKQRQNSSLQLLTGPFVRSATDVFFAVYTYEYPTKLWRDQSSFEWTCHLQALTKPSYNRRGTTQHRYPPCTLVDNVMDTRIARIYDELGVRFLRVTGQVSGRQGCNISIVIAVHDQRPIFGTTRAFLTDTPTGFMFAEGHAPHFDKPWLNFILQFWAEEVYPWIVQCSPVSHFWMGKYSKSTKEEQAGIRKLCRHLLETPTQGPELKELQ